MRLDDTLPQTTPLQTYESTQGATDNPAEPSSTGFKQAMGEVQSLRTVKSGDNLVNIVKQQAQSQGLRLTDSQAMRWAQTLATQNGVSNANRIFPGQQLNLSSMHSQWKEFGPNAPAKVTTAATSTPATSTPATSTPANTSPATNAARVPEKPQATAAVLSAKAALNQYASAPNNNAGTYSRNSTANANANANANASKTAPAGAVVLGTAHPVLDKTLARAVDKGFIPANEKQAVYQKVMQMASKHGFAPDDFARISLMESDGLNPKATNQRCHGIIQFCDGPARGAAAVGMADNPKSILGLSVYQQLHLADTYFDKSGLKKQQGTVPLDDLYLSVLQPAARSETRPDVPLGIPGAQAGALYGDKSSSPAITRQSLVRGLMQNAQRVLGIDRGKTKATDERAQTPTAAPPSSSPVSSSPVLSSPVSSNTSSGNFSQAQQVASYAASDTEQTFQR
jgi:hypothetical protein